MTGCRDMDKKHQKRPQNGVFPPFMTPKIFFKNQALSLLHPYGTLTSYKTRQVYNGPREVKFISAKSKKKNWLKMIFEQKS